MPRNTSGTYTLPTGNPVTTRTLIESSWANSTLGDIANEITNSLARNGDGGMTGPLKATDGSVSAPSVTFGLEVSTGLYRVSSGQIGIATLGVQRFTISGSDATFSVPVTVNSSLTVSGGVSVSGTISGNGSGLTSLNASNITTGTLADAQLSSNVARRNAANTFTIGQEVASASNPLWQTRDTGNTSIGTIRHLDSGGYVGDISFYSSAHASKPSWIVYNAGARHSFSLGGSEKMYITSAGNVTINAPASGTALTVNGRAFATPVSVSFSATPTFDSSQSNTIYFGTMTANVTSMTISNPVDGAQLQIRFVQDATGGRTVTLPSNVQVSGSLNTAANAVTWLVLTYVSSASRWEGTWTKVS
jgi:hypothetical protein